jgi:hypothetical protein
MPLNDEEVITTADGRSFTVAELKSSHSTTPKGDITWYIKWIASIITLFAVSWIGAVGWFVVGFMWKDRALIILNGVIGVILFSGLIKLFFG